MPSSGQSVLSWARTKVKTDRYHLLGENKPRYLLAVGLQTFVHSFIHAFKHRHDDTGWRQRGSCAHSHCCTKVLPNGTWPCMYMMARRHVPGIRNLHLSKYKSFPKVYESGFRWGLSWFLFFYFFSGQINVRRAFMCEKQLRLIALVTVWLPFSLSTLCLWLVVLRKFHYLEKQGFNQL